MRKGIYLDVVMRLDNAEEAENAMPALKAIINQSLAKGTPIAQLTGEIKRIRPHANADSSEPHIEALVYMEGEQEPAHNFYTLAVAEVKAVLDAAFHTPVAPDVNAHLTDIQENTNAVDELAEEELLAEEAQADNPPDETT